MYGVNKWALRFIRFMVGLLCGFFVTVSVIKDSIAEKNVPWFPRVNVSGVPEDYSDWKIIFSALGIMLVLLIVITLVVRLLMTSESLSGTAIVLSVVADFLVGVPLATAIWWLIAEAVYAICGETLLVSCIVLAVVYACIYVFACVLIDIFYSPWILKPLKKREK